MAAPPPSESYSTARSIARKNRRSAARPPHRPPRSPCATCAAEPSLPLGKRRSCSQWFARRTRDLARIETVLLAASPRSAKSHDRHRLELACRFLPVPADLL